jgi:hypothetical protein
MIEGLIDATTSRQRRMDNPRPGAPVDDPRQMATSPLDPDLLLSSASTPIRTTRHSGDA